jgi:hypothetical protein
MTEMDKLDAALTERGIEHIYGRRFPEIDKIIEGTDLFKDQDWGTQIIVYENGVRKWDAICGYGSHGVDQGLIEIAGSITKEDVEGYLTAEDIIKRIKQ